MKTRISAICHWPLAITALLLLLAAPAGAGVVSFAWDPSPTTNVTVSYYFFGSTNLTTLTNTPHSSAVVIDCGTNRTVSIDANKSGAWWFAASAYVQTNKLESGLSNILPLVFPAAPASTVIIIPQYTAMIVDTNWTDIPGLFFRLKIGLP